MLTHYDRVSKFERERERERETTTTTTATAATRIKKKTSEPSLLSTSVGRVVDRGLPAVGLLLRSDDHEKSRLDAHTHTHTDVHTWKIPKKRIELMKKQEEVERRRVRTR